MESASSMWPKYSGLSNCNYDRNPNTPRPKAFKSHKKEQERLQSEAAARSAGRTTGRLTHVGMTILPYGAENRTGKWVMARLSQTGLSMLEDEYIWTILPYGAENRTGKWVMARLSQTGLSMLEDEYIW
ncbi:unnamed protein product [Heligmosomoides polygyrus]|uniref:Uncharacterized protein n=1 Tax=Heligmosomoides polygyrus TaxID=6339 RepID=A0A183FGC6_HELPZ|nr:unnamed protein product [Heligmosomoides polygyrus]